MDGEGEREREPSSHTSDRYGPRWPTDTLGTHSGGLRAQARERVSDRERAPPLCVRVRLRSSAPLSATERETTTTTTALTTTTKLTWDTQRETMRKKSRKKKTRTKKKKTTNDGLTCSPFGTRQRHTHVWNGELAGLREKRKRQRITATHAQAQKVKVRERQWPVCYKLRRDT